MESPLPPYTKRAVILVGGLGSRLAPFTQIIPKPLLPVGEKSVLEIQIERLAASGFSEVYLATNFGSQYIERFFGDGSQFGVKLYFSREEKPLGTAGPLTLLKDKLSEPFLLMNGDILTLLDFGKMYESALRMNSDLTVGVKDILTPFQFGNIHSKGDFVTKIEEKPELKTTILAGIYVMTPGIFRYIPENEYYGMDSLITSMLEADQPVTKYDIKDYWLDIGQVDDYQKAQTIYDTHFKKAV